MKKRLIVSFSGGRTSAYMLWWLFNEWEDRHNWEIIVVFANTGKEVEGTLFFVDECSQEWGVPIVWVEGVPVSEKGWAVEAKVVSYETASRKGEPFLAMIKKLGIPNQAAPFCSPQLKREVIKAYAKSIGWGEYCVAIGIRYDEPNRVNRESNKQDVIYPLVDFNPTTKRQISEWWLKQPFDLNIHPDDGNCDNCWKKADDRLVRNIIRRPESFKWWEDIEKQYSNFNPRENNTTPPPYNFFRKNKSVIDIRELSKLSLAELRQLSMFDEIDPCNESCEAF